MQIGTAIVSYHSTGHRQQATNVHTLEVCKQAQLVRFIARTVTSVHTYSEINLPLVSPHIKFSSECKALRGECEKREIQTKFPVEHTSEGLALTCSNHT